MNVRLETTVVENDDFGLNGNFFVTNGKVIAVFGCSLTR